jgi:hypothetical protein
MDRINTMDLLDRKHCAPLNATTFCSSCLVNARETREHLLFQCEFSKSCWNRLGWSWNASVDFHQMLQMQRDSFPHLYFMELFLLAAWNIWKERNGLIFQGIIPSVSNWRRI